MVFAASSCSTILGFVLDSVLTFASHPGCCSAVCDGRTVAYALPFHCYLDELTDIVTCAINVFLKCA